ncbi:MAG: hypothetical protein V3R51_00180 [Gammaproteobacteria bacterium]
MSNYMVNCAGFATSRLVNIAHQSVGRLQPARYQALFDSWQLRDSHRQQGLT